MAKRLPSRKLKVVFGFYLRFEWGRWFVTFHRPRSTVGKPKVAGR